MVKFESNKEYMRLIETDNNKIILDSRNFSDNEKLLSYIFGDSELVDFIDFSNIEYDIFYGLNDDAIINLIDNYFHIMERKDLFVDIVNRVNNERKLKYLEFFFKNRIRFSYLVDDIINAFDEKIYTDFITKNLHKITNIEDAHFIMYKGKIIKNYEDIIINDESQLLFCIELLLIYMKYVNTKEDINVEFSKRLNKSIKKSKLLMSRKNNCVDIGSFKLELHDLITCEVEYVFNIYELIQAGLVDYEILNDLTEDEIGAYNLVIRSDVYYSFKNLIPLIISSGHLKYFYNFLKLMNLYYNVILNINDNINMNEKDEIEFDYYTSNEGDEYYSPMLTMINNEEDAKMIENIFIDRLKEISCLANPIETPIDKQLKRLSCISPLIDIERIKNNEEFKKAVVKISI